MSVIIPSHSGRLHWMRRLLDSLIEAAPKASEPTEVIVVDDSEGPESSCLSRVCAEHRAVYLRGPANAGAKRNVGYRSARFDVLLFIDSDCTADPELLREHLRTLRSSDDSVGAVLGLTTMVGPEPFHWQVADHSHFYNQCYEFALDYERVLWGTTSNLACRRAALDRIGGFDPATLTRVGGEDVDIGTRLNQSGYTVVTNPRAMVRHSRDHITGLRQITHSLFTYGRADTYLLLRHPKRGVFHAAPGVTLGLLLMVGASQAPFVPAGLHAAGWVLGGVGLAAFAYRIAHEVESGRASNLYRPGARGQAMATVGRSRSRRALLTTLAYTVDRLFAIGSWFEAIRQRRPWLALRRFAYTGGAEFVPRLVVKRAELSTPAEADEAALRG